MAELLVLSDPNYNWHWICCVVRLVTNKFPCAVNTEYKRSLAISLITNHLSKLWLNVWHSKRRMNTSRLNQLVFLSSVTTWSQLVRASLCCMYSRCLRTLQTRISQLSSACSYFMGELLWCNCKVHHSAYLDSFVKKGHCESNVYFPGTEYNKKSPMFPCACSVLDHRWRQPVIRAKKSCVRTVRRVCHWSSCRILASFVVQHWTEALKSICFIWWRNKRNFNSVVYTSVFQLILSENQPKCDNNLTCYVVKSICRTEGAFL